MIPIDDGPLDFNALLDSTQLLEQILDALEALVVVVDRQGRIVLFNRACARAADVAADRMLGESFVDVLVPPDQRAQVRLALDQLFTESPALHWESPWATDEETERLILWSATRIGDEVGRATGGMVTGIDVTQQRALEHEVISADEELRQQFGAELHDMLASHLAGTAMMASALTRKVEKGKRAETEELRRLTGLVRDAMEQVRALSHSFVAPELDTDDLLEALDRLTERTEAASGIACACTVQEEARTAVPSGEAAIHLYRIAQEALHNAVTHADPNRVELTLGFGDGSSGEKVLVLTVHDDGQGVSENRSEGVGLRNMRRRAGLMNASLCVKTALEEGTEVRCTVPLSAASPSDGAVRHD